MEIPATPRPVPGSFPALRFELLERDLRATWQRSGIPGGSVAEQRVRAGHRCHALTRDGTLIGALWLTESAVRDPSSGQVFRPGKGETYLYDAWITPQERSLRLSLELVRRVAHLHLAPMGIRRILSFYFADNREAAVIHSMLGCMDLGTVTAYRFGPIRVRRFSAAGTAP